VQFGIMMDPHIDRWELAAYVEELGFDRVNVPDSQMIWSDPYAVLALVAANTKRIQIGTGITSPALRIAPVTACGYRPHFGAPHRPQARLGRSVARVFLRGA
jgi:5,10-methylenetetrahydromethanopterin reductase